MHRFSDQKNMHRFSDQKNMHRFSYQKNMHRFVTPKSKLVMGGFENLVSHFRTRNKIVLKFFFYVCK